jgi:hypothetical protein
MAKFLAVEQDIMRSYRSVKRLAQILLYRAAVDTSSLAKANTDAAKMRCNDKRGDEDADRL